MTRARRGNGPSIFSGRSVGPFFVSFFVSGGGGVGSGCFFVSFGGGRSSFLVSFLVSGGGGSFFVSFSVSFFVSFGAGRSSGRVSGPLSATSVLPGCSLSISVICGRATTATAPARPATQSMRRAPFHQDPP